MQESEFVAGAQQMLHSEFFKELERQLRARAFNKFEHSGPDETNEREAAYAELGGLRSIRRELENRISKFRHAEKSK